MRNHVNTSTETSGYVIPPTSPRGGLLSNPRAPKASWFVIESEATQQTTGKQGTHGKEIKIFRSELNSMRLARYLIFCLFGITTSLATAADAPSPGGVE